MPVFVSIGCHGVTVYMYCLLFIILPGCYIAGADIHVYICHYYDNHVSTAK